MGFQTDCTHTGEDREAYFGAVAPPIYAASLFTAPSFEEFEASFASSPPSRYIYTRGLNPTVRVLEQKLALLERAEESKFFGSGMAAIAAVIMECAHAGDHVLAGKSLYAHTHKLLVDYLPSFGIETTFVDMTDLDVVEHAVRPNTTLLYLESPGNPTMQVTDLRGAVALARRHGLVTAIDNSMATPYNQRPVELGIDYVVHTATKYLAGHSDVVAGAVAGSAERMAPIINRQHADLGGILGPFEAWLVLRGLRTLGLRMKAHNEAGLRLAMWLEAQPGVARVHHPSLGSHPQHALVCDQMTGGSGVVGFALEGGIREAECFVNTLKIFSIAVSWGGFESLALPMWKTSPLPEEMRREIGLTKGFVRISVGLEDVEDLQEDLCCGLRATMGVAA